MGGWVPDSVLGEGAGLSPGRLEHPLPRVSSAAREVPRAGPTTDLRTLWVALGFFLLMLFVSPILLLSTTEETAP